MSGIEFKSKIFGDVVISIEDNDASLELQFENQDLFFFFTEYAFYGDKAPICFKVIDNYLEMNQIAKKEIIEHFSKNATIRYYFECHFDMLDKEELIEIFGVDDFQKMDIESVVKKLGYPDLLLGIQKNGEITISVDYQISKEYSDEILCVRMDENFNVVDFSHES